MIILDKKKSMYSIMAKRHPKDGTEMHAEMVPQEVKTDDGNADPRFVASQDILMAIKDGKPHELMEALKNFMELHSVHTKER